MNVVCRYCGGLVDTEKDVCSHCGASHASMTSNNINNYSCEFIQKLSEIAVLGMRTDTAVVLEGLFTERLISMPERVYVADDYGAISGYVKSWLDNILIEHHPEFCQWSPSMDMTGKVVLTRPTLRMIYEAYSRMSARLYRDIYIGLTTAGTPIKALCVGEHISWSNGTFPLDIWVDGYTEDIGKIIKSATKDLAKDLNIGHGWECRVQNITSLVNNNSYDTKIVKYDWTDLCLLSCMQSIEFLDKYSKFVKNERYDFCIERHEGCDAVYVFHEKSGQYLMLPDMVKLVNVTETDSVMYDPKRIKIVPNSSLFCTDDSVDNLKFTASWEEKQSPLGGLGKLLGAAFASNKS